MRHRLSIFAAFIIVLIAAEAAGATPLVTPYPKELRITGEVISLAPGSVAIVLGEKASEPEVYAAEMLQFSVKKRFGQTWPIVREKQDLKSHNVLILLGQRTTHAMLDRFCTKLGLDLSEKSPGHDGYIIHTNAPQKPTVVLVGGSNPRGVIYGQDSLFQLVTLDPGKPPPSAVSTRRWPTAPFIGPEAGKLVLTGVSIRDWPSIPWRGKPQTSLEIHLTPGMMDWYLRSRMNFTDLRNGTYAFEPEDALNAELITKVLKEAHRRGMIVYGSVNCGVERTRHEAVLKQFESFISLGVDGLWMSFDDKGPGEAPAEMVAKVVELGKSHGITGHLLATTPPGGSYQVILSDFNRTIAAVPGMEEATWFFSSIPSEQALKDARSIGLKSDPGWWHNWPRVPGHGMIGRSSHAYSFNSGTVYERKDHKPPYLPVPTLEEGWHQPTYSELADAGERCDAVMQWGGSAWKYECTYPVLGWWGWSPKGHDWLSARDRIYDLVFGPDKAMAAKQVDGSIASMRQFFTFTAATTEGEIESPPRLVSEVNRRIPQTEITYMEEALVKLGEPDPAQSFVADPERLKTYFFDAMHAELTTAKAATELAYPEYWWDEHQRKLLKAVYADDKVEAEKLIAEVRPRVASEVSLVQEKLAHLDGLDKYAKWCNDRASMNFDAWKAFLADRQKRFGELVNTLDDRKIGKKITTYLGNLNAPPQDFEATSTLMPGDKQQFWGAMLAGQTKKFGPDLFIFAYPLKQGSRIGDYCETEIEIPWLDRRGWRGVRFFINTWTNDIIADENMVGRYLGRRYIQLLLGSKVLWESDVSLPRGKGEWVTVGLPEINGILPLRLRVEDRQESYNYSSMVFLSPIQVLLRPR